jgi:hypothetical protein
MTTPTIEAKKVLQLIREDCLRDVENMEGTPLTGNTVAVMNGHTLAMITALTNVIDSIIDRLDERTEQQGDASAGS